MTKTANEAGLDPYAAQVFTGPGAAVRTLRLQIARVAPYFRVAMLRGERGAGQPTIARELHRLSPARDAPILHLTTANWLLKSEPEHGASTLFLSAPEDVPLRAQAGLLRRLTSLPRDTRVIFNTEKDLKGMTAAGRLHPDLAAWICTLEIHAPPLRERRADVPAVAASMLRSGGSLASFSVDLLEQMQAHPWPGNFEELWRFCGAAAHRAGNLGPDDLPRLAGQLPPSTETVRLDAVIERHVMDVLENCSGNKLRAAELLGISRSTLYRMLGSAAA